MAWAAAAIAAVALAYVYATHDPSEPGWYLRCPFHAVTGYECPGCGSQRALHALLNGQLSQAWAYNPFFLVIVPTAAFMGVVEYGRSSWPRLYAAIYRPWVFIVITIAIIGWWIYRNI